MSRRAVVALVAVLAVAVAGLVAWRLLTPGTPMERALSMAPAATSRASWTDWDGVRRELGADVDGGSSAEEVDAFVSEAFSKRRHRPAGNEIASHGSSSTSVTSPSGSSASVPYTNFHLPVSGTNIST